MTREKIAGFLLGIGVGTALGFLLRADEEEKYKRDEFGNKTPGISGGRLETGRPATPMSQDVGARRTSFAM